MARSVVDLAEFEDAPALKALIEEVRESNQPMTIRSLGIDLVVVTPAPPRRRFQKGEPTSEDDPIWNIVGIVTSDGPDDVALNHDKYLAEAYMDLHEE